MSFEELEKQEEDPALLHIDNPDIVSIIAQIEGAGWQSQQEQELDKKDKVNDEARQGESRSERVSPGGEGGLGHGEDVRNYSILAAQKFAKRFRNRIISLKQELATETDSTEIKELEDEIAEYESGHGPKAEVYGAGGVNRYFVLSNGDVVISESHLSGLNKEDKLEKAKQLGISSI